jgi:hypothetical protein
MLWMSEHKRIWRLAILVLLIVAITGPWAFDRINVPSEFTCSAPFVRLEGDFCGSPQSGLWMLSTIVQVLAYIVVGVVTGTTIFTERAGEFSFALLGLLFVLPLFSMLFLVLRGDSQRRLVFQVAVLGLAVGLGLLLGISYPGRPFWLLWGPWLYVGVAAIALIFEGAMLASERWTAEGRKYPVSG